MPRLFDLLSAFSDSGPALTQLLEDHNPGDLQLYLRENRGDPLLPGKIGQLIEELVRVPQDYRDKDVILNIIMDHGFDFTKFYIDQDIDQLWTLWARNPAQNTAKFSAMLISEALRAHQMRHDTPYELPFERFLESPDSLKTHHNSQRNKEAILVTQNALVDFVSEEGPRLPVNRGAAFLHLMGREDMSALWTRKMAGIERRSQYSLTQGDVYSFAPRFD